MADQSVNDFFNEILNGAKDIAKSAVLSAASTVQQDIVREAESYLQMYYDNYTPKSYKRKYNLKKAIVPVFENNSNKGTISYVVGVEYSSWKLHGLYKSNSRFHQSGDTWKSVKDHSKLTTDNGIPEPDWILENFLEGVHPWAQDDAESTNTLMRDFFDNKLPDRINQYVQKELFDKITSRL
jgi:hypothetical protein